MSKKYQIIYADPPWQYSSTENMNRPSDKIKTSCLTKNIDFHYPTMSIKELINMKSFIDSISDNKNCLIYMWVVSPMLDDGIKLLKEWGFKYCTIAYIWDKQIPNMGHYTMGQCELCIVGKRGIIPNRNNRNTKQFLSEKKQRHSAKPKEIRDRIYNQHCNVDINFIELFAREKSENWDVWGDEIE